MKITGDWISNADSRRIIALLTDAGHQAFFVGGCVRNALLGVPISDIDIATDARPQTVIELAKAAQLKAIPTGVDHGTVTLVLNGTPFEVTTFRRDVETDGRRAVVAFSDTINDDARRRDFTMNALYADAKGQVVDPLDGLPDLNARRVRFIDDAHHRIREDYLRILRFFRFFAWYGDPAQGLDADGLAACAELAGGINGLSKERIGSEMIKLLSAKDPGQAIASMAASGVLLHVLEVGDARAVPLLIHFEQEFDLAPDAKRRLAALAPENAVDALRLDKATGRYLDQVIPAAQAGAVGAAQGYRLGYQTALDAALLRAAWTEMPPSPGLVDALQRGALAVFPIKAQDVMDHYQGKALGAALKTLEARWIASDFTLTKAQLLA